MAEENNPPESEQLKDEFAELTMQMEGVLEDANSYHVIDDLVLLNAVYYIWIHWIDFHVHILEPAMAKTLLPVMIEPATDAKTKQPEHVYRIFDFGNRFSASAGQDILKGSRSTGKMLNTVKKMMNLVLERVRTHLGTTELSPEVEIRLAFDGHEISQRMAFKDCIMRPENIAISNYEPGEWGELQLRTMEVLAAKGYLPGL